MTDAYLIDDDRSVCLCDVGLPDYLAATAIDADGNAHLVLAERDAIGAEDVRYDASCAAVAHEQPGRLPVEYTRRIAVSRRRVHRCGRPTKTTGWPCRIEVSCPGAPCGLHRTVPRPEDAAWW